MGGTLRVGTWVLVCCMWSGCASSTTVVFCEDLDCDDDNPCTTDSCDPANPQCEHDALPNGSMCEADAQPGQCLDAECVLLTCVDLSCDTGNPCAVESCDAEQVVCLSEPVPDDTPCEIAGEPAVCEAGTCRALTCDEKSCNDGNPCTINTCDEETVECASAPVTDDTVCAVLGAFGVCSAGVCDLSAPVEFGSLRLIVEYVPEPDDPVFYEAVCSGAVAFSAPLARQANGSFEAFIALPVGSCTLSSFVPVGDERRCEIQTMSEVTPGFAGDLEVTGTCP